MSPQPQHKSMTVSIGTRQKHSLAQKELGKGQDSVAGPCVFWSFLVAGMSAKSSLKVVCCDEMDIAQKRIQKKTIIKTFPDIEQIG